MSGIPGVDMFPRMFPKPWPGDPLMFFERVCGLLNKLQLELEFVAWPDDVRAGKEWLVGLLAIMRDECLKELQAPR